MNILSELMRTVVIMTISGGLIGLLLLVIKPLMRHRLPKSAQYYLWLVVLGALLIPVSRFVVLPDAAPNIAPIHNVVERNVISIGEETTRMLELADAPWQAYAAANNIAPEDAIRTVRPDFVMPPELPPAGFAIASTILMLIYPWIALGILLYSIGIYARFTGKIRRHNVAPQPAEIAMLKEICAKHRRIPRLYRNTFAATPMLIGIFRPVIILPDREYTDIQLQSILLHEITHLRRFDVAIKWLSLLACAMHWFNPVVWLVRREIDRICELSCDEAVIHDMDIKGKQSYGETLISVAADTKTPLAVLSTTMCEEKKALKERLTGIMKSKKHTKLAVFVSIIIILTAGLGACALGAAGGGSDNGGGEVLSDNPITVQSLADGYIQHLVQGLNVAIFEYGNRDVPIYTRPANILEIRVNTLEKEAEFDNIVPYTIELWRLDFMVLTDDLETETLRWGTFFPDDEGWVGHHTAWNDARTLLAFAWQGDEVTLLGQIPWWMEETPDGLEGALRTFLENEGVIDSPAGITHRFDNLGFSVEFPAFWEGKYGIEESYWELDSGVAHFTSIYHIATREEIGEGRLITLGRAVGEHFTYDNAPIMAGGSIFLAQTGGYTYFVNFPSDVQHNYSDPNSGSSAEYLEMVGHWEPSHWDFLVNSFRLIERRILHRFDNLGFSVEFPAFWEGKYGLHEFEIELDFGTRHSVEVYHIATREEMFEETGFPYGGRIMTLGRSPREGYTYDNAPTMAGGTIFLAQTGGNTYFVNFPSGVEHTDNPETSAEFLEIIGHYEPSHWDFLVNSFRLIEGHEAQPHDDFVLVGGAIGESLRISGFSEVIIALNASDVIILPHEDTHLYLNVGGSQNFQSRMVGGVVWVTDIDVLAGGTLAVHVPYDWVGSINVSSLHGEVYISSDLPPSIIVTGGTSAQPRPNHYVTQVDGRFEIDGLGGHVSYNPHDGSIYFAGSGFTVGVLADEAIEGMVFVTRDSLRISLMVARNEIILTQTDGPLGTLAGPWVEFEYLPEIGLIEMINHPFEFQNDQEPLHFELPEEDAIAFARMMLQVLHMVDEYINAAP